MKRILALTLTLAACHGSDTPSAPTTTVPPTNIQAGPALDRLNSNWFEATDPDGRRYWCLFVGWDEDPWSDSKPRTGALSIDCHPTLEIP